MVEIVKMVGGVMRVINFQNFMDIFEKLFTTLSTRDFSSSMTFLILFSPQNVNTPRVYSSVVFEKLLNKISTVEELNNVSEFQPSLPKDDTQRSGNRKLIKRIISHRRAHFVSHILIFALTLVVCVVQPQIISDDVEMSESTQVI